MDSFYQLIIIGGGPAGLCAGVYAARSRISTLLIEKAVPGGQIINAAIVENYPGFPQGIPGMELGTLMEQQASKYNVEMKMAEVEGLDLKGREKIVNTSEGQYSARSIIIAGGSEYGKLGVPAQEEFRGRGVAYCATCDGAFFSDQVIAVVGGGDVALNDALFLTRFASKVIVIHRRDQFRATKILQERAFAELKIEVLWNKVVESIKGDNQVRELSLLDIVNQSLSKLEVSGVFVAVGLRPNTGYLKGMLDLSSEGFIVVDNQMETSVPGVFAAGDIRAGSARQVSCAVGDGATAAISAERFLSSAA